MRSAGDAVRRLVAACPGFQGAWQAHLDWWAGEPAGVYNDLGALAHWVVVSVRNGDVDCFKDLFRELEALLREASPEVRELLVIGFIEDIQNISANSGPDVDAVLAYLGPESRKGWFEVIHVWHGPDGAGWPGQTVDR